MINLVENKNQAFPRKECAQFNDYVTIYHSDGTFANYVHLMKNGFLAKVSIKFQQVRLLRKVVIRDEPDSIYIYKILQKMKHPKTLKIIFKKGDGINIQFLMENEN